MLSKSSYHNRLYLCVLAFIITTVMNAQTPQSWSYDSYNGFSSIEIDGGYDSDGITSLLTNAFIRGGFIDRETRLQSQPDNNSLRTFGAHFKGELNLSFPSRLIKKDSLSLFFFGNEHSLKDSISLNGSRWNQWNIKSIGIGIYDLKSNNYITTNIYIGQNKKMLIEKGFLYTGEDGRYLQSDLSGTYFNSKYNEDNGRRAIGIGIGVNGRYNLLKSSSSFDLNMQVDNLGIMVWAKGGKQIAIEDNIDFDGIDINLLLAENTGSSSLFLTELKDSNLVSSDRIEMLPTVLSGYSSYSIDQKNSLHFGVSSRMINLWRPQFDVAFSRKMNEKIIVGAGLKYGGYGGFNYNLQCTYDSQKKWGAQVYFNYLEGLLTSKGYGSHVGFVVKRRMNFNTKK